jgi:hypothetical protein
MAHSLTAAVADGTITEHTAFCGLTQADVTHLAKNHPEARLLVRFRSAHADGRMTVSAKALEAFEYAEIDGTRFYGSDIRDVMAVAQ